jgi:hypothetical protein
MAMRGNKPTLEEEVAQKVQALYPAAWLAATSPDAKESNGEAIYKVGG